MPFNLSLLTQLLFVDIGGLFFLGRVFLYSPGCPQTHNPPTSDSPGLKLKACASMPSSLLSFKLCFLPFYRKWHIIGAI
jgi:hypothetical protein